MPHRQYSGSGYDYTRVEVGSRIRDNQTLDEGTVVDIQSAGQWLVAITMVMAASGQKRTIQVHLRRLIPGTAGAPGTRIDTLSIDDLDRDIRVVSKPTPGAAPESIKAAAAAGRIKEPSVYSAERLKKILEENYDKVPTINGVEKAELQELVDALIQAERKEGTPALARAIDAHGSLVLAGSETAESRRDAIADIIRRARRHGYRKNSERAAGELLRILERNLPATAPGAATSTLGALSAPGYAQKLISQATRRLRAGEAIEDIVDGYALMSRNVGERAFEASQRARGLSGLERRLMQLRAGRIYDVRNAINEAASELRIHSNFGPLDVQGMADEAAEASDIFNFHGRARGPSALGIAREIDRQARAAQSLRGEQRITSPYVKAYRTWQALHQESYTRGFRGNVHVTDRYGFRLRVLDLADTARPKFIAEHTRFLSDTARFGVVLNVPEEFLSSLGDAENESYKLLSRAIQRSTDAGTSPAGIAATGITDDVFYKEVADSAGDPFELITPGQRAHLERAMRDRAVSQKLIEVRRAVSDRALEGVGPGRDIEVDDIVNEIVVRARARGARMMHGGQATNGVDALIRAMDYYMAPSELFRLSQEMRGRADAFMAGFDIEGSDVLDARQTRIAEHANPEVLAMRRADRAISREATGHAKRIISEIEAALATRLDQGLFPIPDEHHPAMSVVVARVRAAVAELPEEMREPVERAIGHRLFAGRFDLEGWHSRDIVGSVFGDARITVETMGGRRVAVLSGVAPSGDRRGILSAIGEWQQKFAEQTGITDPFLRRTHAGSELPVIFDAKSGRGVIYLGEAMVGMSAETGKPVRVKTAKDFGGAMHILDDPVAVPKIATDITATTSVYDYNDILTSEIERQATPVSKLYRITRNVPGPRVMRYVSSAYGEETFGSVIGNIRGAIGGEYAGRSVIGLDIETVMEGDRAGEIWDAGIRTYTLDDSGRLVAAGPAQRISTNLRHRDGILGIYQPRRGVAETAARGESEIIESAARKIAATPAGLLFGQNLKFDIDYLAKRSRELGLVVDGVPAEQIFSEARPRILDAMTAATFRGRPLAQVGVEQLAWEYGVLSRGAKLLHVGVEDVDVTAKVWNRMIAEPEIARGVAEGAVSMTAARIGTDIRYGWDYQTGYLKEFSGWYSFTEEGGREGQAALLYNEVTGIDDVGRPIYGRTRQLTGLEHRLGVRLGELEPVSLEEGVARYNRYTEDLALRRIRRMRSDFTLIAEERRRLSMVDAMIEGRDFELPTLSSREVQDAAGRHADMVRGSSNLTGSALDDAAESAYRSYLANEVNMNLRTLNWATNPMWGANPRMWTQFETVRGWFESDEYRRLLSPVEDWLSTAEMSDFEKNRFWSKWLGYLDRVNPLETIEGQPVDALDRKVSFRVPGGGQNPVALRIASRESLDASIARAADDYAKVLTGTRGGRERLRRVLDAFGPGVSERVISDYLESAAPGVLGNDLADFVRRHLWENDLFKGFGQNLTTFAESTVGGRIFEGLKEHGYTARTLEDILLSVGADDNLTAEDYGAFVEYSATDPRGRSRAWTEADVESALAKFESAKRRLLSGEADDLVERAAYADTLPFTEDVPYHFRGRTIEEGEESIMARFFAGDYGSGEEAERYARRRSTRDLFDLYRDPSFGDLQPNVQKAVTDYLGVGTVRDAIKTGQAELAADVLVPTGQHAGKRFADLSYYQLSEMTKSHELTEEYRGLIQTFLTGATPSQMVDPALVSTTHRRAMAHFETIGSLVRGASGGRAGFAMKIAGGAAAAIMMSKPNVGSPEEKMSPERAYAHHLGESERPLYHRIEARIYGDAPADGFVSEDELIQSARAALGGHMRSGISDVNRSSSDHRTEYNRRTVEAAVGDIMMGREIRSGG